ncbi:uncharacterized protein (UPF0303 family) [Arthrobacter globiformis]|nr:uncharacterized protein (UPF0303 family) [Arthrobacter globiformis]
MTETVQSRITELQLHEEELVFPGFDHHDAFLQTAAG